MDARGAQRHAISLFPRLPRTSLAARPASEPFHHLLPPGSTQVVIIPRWGPQGSGDGRRVGMARAAAGWQGASCVASRCGVGVLHGSRCGTLMCVVCRYEWLGSWLGRCPCPPRHLAVHTERPSCPGPRLQLWRALPLVCPLPDSAGGGGGPDLRCLKHLHGGLCSQSPIKHLAAAFTAALGGSCYAFCLRQPPPMHAFPTPACIPTLCSPTATDDLPTAVTLFWLCKWLCAMVAAGTLQQK